MPNIDRKAGAESAGPFLHVAVFVVHDDDYLAFGSKSFNALIFDAWPFQNETFDIPAISVHAASSPIYRLKPVLSLQDLFCILRCSWCMMMIILPLGVNHITP